MANPHPLKRGPAKDKPFRDALRMEIAAMGTNFKGLRVIARSLIDNATGGDYSSIREIADRFDGKVPQAIVGDDDYDAVRIDDVNDDQRAKALAVLMAKAGAK